MKVKGNRWCRSLLIVLLSAAMLVQGFGRSQSSAAGLEAEGTWIYEGNREIAAKAALPEIAYNSKGELYIKYLAAYKSGNGIPSIQKYDGVKWKMLPTPPEAIPMPAASVTSSFVIDNDIPYLAYRGDKNELHVSKLAEEGWETLGGPVFVSESTTLEHITLTIVDGTPYVAYSGVVKGEKVWQIKKYIAGAWTLIPSPEGSHPSSDAPFAIDDDGILYVGYISSNSAQRATVKKYNPDRKEWERIGNQNFTGGALSMPKLIVEDGILYFGYVDSSANGNRLTVMEHSAGELLGDWTKAGNTVSENRVSSYTLSAEAGKVYAMYRDYTEPYTVSAKSLIKLLDGSYTWDKLGESLSVTVQSLSDMTVRGGVPYVSYVEDGKTGSISIIKYSDADFKLWGQVRDSAVQLEWDAAEKATGYIIFKDGVQFSSVGREGRSDVIPKLENNTSYRFMIRTVDGRYSNEIKITPLALPPTAPLHVQTTSVNNAQVNISWDPVTAATGADATGYYIYQRDAEVSSYPDTPAAVVTGNSSTAYTLTEGLTSGKTVYFKVRAFNENGVSDEAESAEVNATPGLNVWESLGTVSSSATMDNSLIVNDGTPFLAIVENGKVSVKKHTPTGWEYVGSPGFLEGGVGYTSLAFFNNVPYVASTDIHNSVTVMKYTGKGATKWEPVGGRSIVDKLVDNVVLAIDKNGIPFVAFNVQPAHGQEPGAMVMRYSGEGDTGWELVGDGIISVGAAGTYVSLFVDGITPYVAFRDNNANRGTVMMYDGGQWVALGGRGFTKNMTTAKAVKWTSVFVYEGTPYLAFRDVGPNLVKFNGQNWDYVGSKNFEGNPDNDLNYTRLFIDQGIPYILFRSAENGGKAIVMKYTGKGDKGWEFVGNKSFSKGAVDHTSLYVEDGIVYAAFTDMAQSGGDYRTVVMRFDDSGSAPAVPLNVTASARDRGVELNWSASPNADHYNIYLRTAGEGYGAPAGVATSTYLSVKELANDTTYYVTVTSASETAGESGKSMEVAVTPFDTAAPPLVAPIEVSPGGAPGRALVKTAVYDEVYHELKRIVSVEPLDTPDIVLDRVPAEAVPVSALPFELADVEAGMYIAIYETDEKGTIFRFSSKLLQRGEVASYPIPMLKLDIVPGKTQGTATVQTTTYDPLNSIAVQVSADAIAVPVKGDFLPAGVLSYKPGEDIAVAAGSYIAVYEINKSRQINGFAQAKVSAGQIYTAPPAGNNPEFQSAVVPPAAKPDLLKVDEAWALKELNNAEAAVLSIDLKDVDSSATGAISVWFPQSVIRLAVQLGKPLQILDRGSKWTIAAQQLLSAEAEEVTLTFTQKTAVDQPANTEGRILYTITSSVKNLDPLDKNSFALNAQISVSGGESDPDKLVIYVQDEQGNWRYLDSKITGGSIEFQPAQWGAYLLTKSTKTFGDLNSHWARHAIEVMAARNIATGTDEGLFAPNQILTRAEFAVMLDRLLNLKMEAAVFKDVPEDAWYAVGVNAAAAAGIIGGAGGVYRPQDSLSRQEMAVMIMRAYHLSNAGAAVTGATPAFHDAGRMGTWAQQAVNEAAALGIIEGQPGGMFKPDGKTTRAEGMTVLYRLLKLPAK
ncbi:S-layer homology domain-containing protein [Paenibacillus sp. FSL H7-0357]|uniref:S-layer homology domain-containing protein n=1 Tax=Paenibacillus sp. FSL H7-0357 TaxID=1536774 RepID=UPI0012E04470|nr:S-layer homology domain-containing protein [Paenibacillus sp. FSL H7-0357]